MAKTDSVIIAGSTVTNGQGHFEIPVEDLKIQWGALFSNKERRERQKENGFNSDGLNFSPNLRSYEYTEWNLNGKMSANGYRTLNRLTRALFGLIRQVDNLHLNTLEVVKETKEKCHYGDSYLPAKVWMLTMISASLSTGWVDEGKEIYTLPELFEKLTPFFRWNKAGRHIQLQAETNLFFLGGRSLTSIEATSIMTEVDGLQSIYICEGANAFSAGAFKDAQVSSLENGFCDFDHEERVNVTELSKYAVFYLTALPLRDIANS
ncbi:hypothetical protein NXW18_00010 [Bacteroides thetaiotaomicron]|uniref:hypothetical protein n=1 Tax=Bacteroides thetaiotaomicron TaxID=818 RepID=UPI002165F78F|nr:hypothetical protein [Bacteroides thetaiotaomicron]MCS2872153.1 hypothetical protein [Bacteroides thetaiotaomicron]